MQTEMGEKTVTLPYDALIYTAARPDAPGAFKTGYFGCGTWQYKKQFFTPEDWREKKVSFRFDGIYRRSMIYINGDYAGGRTNGYSQFFIDADRFLNYGTDNEIKVIVHTSDDERWYSGAGIYRDVYIMTSGLIRVKPQGIKISTPSVTSERASVYIAIPLENYTTQSKTTVKVITELFVKNDNLATSDTSNITLFQGEEALLRQKMYIDNPKLWNVDDPNLYTCRVRIFDNAGKPLDECNEIFGIRSLSLDVKTGLAINGEIVKLRGACIHHDNGPIGAASCHFAEERKIALLKKAGFNAVRTAHNPASPALLSACDELGMLVMEEAFDTWTLNKSNFDYANDFTAHWEEDVISMVDKSYNHPSVIIYSIGNEIADTGTAAGSVMGRKIAEKIRCLDSTRYITNGINGMVSVMELLTGMSKNKQEERQNAGEINSMISNFGDMIKNIIMLDVVTQATAESYAYLDIAGYNYMDRRYEMDKALFPNRVICGTETFPQDIDTNWRKVLDNPHIIGDFTWTGWDYLGEAGIGQVRYSTEKITEGIYGTYPSLTAMCGDISITGFRRPVSYYREIAFGLRKEPYISVQHPEHYHETPFATPWSWSDSVSSWSWDGYEGKEIKVEVYSDAEEVELYLNDKSLGRQLVGEIKRFKVVFDAVYQPGELLAIAYNAGKEQGRYILKTARGREQLSIKPEIVAPNASQLLYVEISITDGNGIIYNMRNKILSIAIEGCGELLGFGTDDPNSVENFYDAERTTFNGRALCVIRLTGIGSLKLTAYADGLLEKTIQVYIKENKHE
jgi:beta-galactosidase